MYETLIIVGILNIILVSSLSKFTWNFSLWYAGNLCHFRNPRIIWINLDHAQLLSHCLHIVWVNKPHHLAIQDHVQVEREVDVFV